MMHLNILFYFFYLLTLYNEFSLTSISLVEDGKKYFVKRDLPYFWPHFLLVKREKPVFIFAKRESAILFQREA